MHRLNPLVIYKLQVLLKFTKQTHSFKHIFYQKRFYTEGENYEVSLTIRIFPGWFMGVQRQHVMHIKSNTYPNAFSVQKITLRRLNAKQNIHLIYLKILNVKFSKTLYYQVKYNRNILGCNLYI